MSDVMEECMDITRLADVMEESMNIPSLKFNFHGEICRAVYSANIRQAIDLKYKSSKPVTISMLCHDIL